MWCRQYFRTGSCQRDLDLAGGLRARETLRHDCWAGVTFCSSVASRSLSLSEPALERLVCAGSGWITSSWDAGCGSDRRDLVSSAIIETGWLETVFRETCHSIALCLSEQGLSDHSRCRGCRSRRGQECGRSRSVALSIRYGGVVLARWCRTSRDTRPLHSTAELRDSARWWADKAS